MKIIAHRGFWKAPEEKNTLKAIERALKNGFGIETDIRDYNGKLVISHNIPDSNCGTLEAIFQLYKELHSKEPLALNIKADGLQKLIKLLIAKYSIENYYLFDMSIPELVVNERENLRYLTRNSDIEKDCVLYEKAEGVWLDSFYDFNWVSVDRILKHIKKGKCIFIVSPELHEQVYLKLWESLRSNDIHKLDNVYLCTDKPKEAEEFFYGKN